MVHHVILAVGSTGTGKSTFGKYLGATNCEVGEGVEAKTLRSEYHVAGEWRYIDTPGFEDTDLSRTNEQHQQDIIKVLTSNQQSYLTTVLWFCNPDERKSAVLQRQANFINDIGKADYERRKHNPQLSRSIWHNTIIIVKKGDTEGLQGPIAAAREANLGEITPQARNLYIMTVHAKSKDLYGHLPLAERLPNGYINGDEAGRFLAPLTNLHKRDGNQINILFLEERCENCPAIGIYLNCTNRGCHVSIQRGHSESGEKGHKSTRKIHKGELIINPEAVRMLTTATGTVATTFGMGKKAIDYIATTPNGAGRAGAAGAAGAVRAVASAINGVPTTIGATAVGGILLGGAIGAAGVLYLNQVYSCCKGTSSSDGCVFECCEKNHGCILLCSNCKDDCQEIGCMDVCKKCKKNIREVKGCDETVPHRIQP